MPRFQHRHKLFSESKPCRSKSGKRGQQDYYDASTLGSFSTEEIDEFRQIFEFYDVIDTKTIDISDLKNSFDALGYNPTQEEINLISSLVKVDEDTTLDFGEFCGVIELIKEKRGKFGNLLEAFKCFDLEKKGYLEHDEIIEMLTTKGDEMSLKQVNEMLRYADRNSTGKVYYEDFIEMLKKSEQDSSGVNISRNPSNLSQLSFRSNVSFNISEKRQKHIYAADKRKKGEKARGEVVDTVPKAIGGPILMNSAVIIKHKQNQLQT